MAFAAAVAQELNEIANRLATLASGDAHTLGPIRAALHRVVVAPQASTSVKTSVVHALLLLDDPRITGGSDGGSLLAKVRKLVAIAAAKSASATPTPAHSSIAVRGAFTPDTLLSPDVDRTLVDEFVAEAREQLETGEAALLVLDSDPDDTQALETLFRSLHSIKGTSAFLGIEPATELAHHAETLLTGVRAKAVRCTADLSNLIFRAIDMLDAMLVAIEQVPGGEVALVPPGYRDLVAELRDAPQQAASSAGAVKRNSGQLRRLMAADLSVRIRSVELDRLAGVVRELALAHAMLARDATLRAHPELARKAAFAERLAFEIEDITTELRTVPFAAVLQRLARLARDAAYQSGKTIELVMEGDDVLVERAMADALADPLMHMVRNAIDHGIESNAERAATLKPASGSLRIAARREGRQLLIDVGDDGRGIDPQRLIHVAAERGLISRDERMSDEDAYSLLFRPGFTTATVVTDLSGRGVGLDIVRTNVESIGGTIDVASRFGHGTTFTIRLPYRTHAARESQQDWIDSERTIGLIA